MKYRLAALSALALALVAPVARADQLTLGASTPLLIIPPGGTGSLNITVTNNVPVDPPAVQMAGWQFTLVVVPDPGATGTISFTNPMAGPPANPAPPNYVFPAGTSFFNGPFVSYPPPPPPPAPPPLRALDFVLFQPAQVPIAPGANLATINFMASAATTGTFGLFALQGAANTAWSDSVGDRFFVNVPNAAGMTRLGTISPVPEPIACTAVLLGGLGVVGAIRRYRRRETAVGA